MRSKGLSQTDIEKVLNFDWDNPEDEENAEEEQEEAANLENIIEETLQSLIDNCENVEVALIEELIGTSDEGNYNDNVEEVMQEVVEKLDLQSLRWRSAELTEYDTCWKGQVCSNEVKQPIDYFTQFFANEVWQMIRDETNLYAVQTNGEK